MVRQKSMLYLQSEDIKDLSFSLLQKLKVLHPCFEISSYSGTSIIARECALQHILQVGGILLTTYDMVRYNFKALRGDFAGRDGYGDRSDDIITWDYMILDEVCLS